MQELRDAVIDFRKSGKPVIAYLEFGGDREYYLASAADQVYLQPSSPLDLTGVASYEIFLRGTLDKLGVQPDFLRIGEYKTAPSQMTEKEMSPAHREMTESINRDTYDRLVSGIAEARKLTEDQVRELMDRGPLLASEAVAGKLVDGVAYEDELDDKVPALREDDEAVDQLEVDDYRRSRGYASGGFRLGGRPRVAVLYAVGTIVSGRGGFDATDGALVGSDTFVEEIRRIKDDSSIRAVVLRIDSPGGSTVASDVIWRELMLLRKDDPERPLVVSMGDLAASGGYYIATPADEIVAQPSTLTGSIGIFVGKYALGQGLEKLGVTTQVVTAGRNADIYSPFTPFTGEQRTRVQAFLDEFYQGFVAKVATSRKKTTAGDRRAGAGPRLDRRTGAGARAGGPAGRAGRGDRRGQGARWYRRRRRGGSGGLSAPADGVRGASRISSAAAAATGMLSALLGRAPARAVAAATAPSRLFRRGEPLALMPFAFVR